MPKKKETKKKEKKLTQKEVFEKHAGVYKGYSIDWLRRESSHPEHHLVEEFDKLPKGEK